MLQLQAEAVVNIHQSCIQGGFIWDWVDQGLLHEVKDANGKAVEAWGYGGDFGDPVHDAQFNINGLIWPNREPHPGCWECKAVMVIYLASSLRSNIACVAAAWCLSASAVTVQA